MQRKKEGSHSVYQGEDEQPVKSQVVRLNPMKKHMEVKVRPYGLIFIPKNKEG